MAIKTYKKGASTKLSKNFTVYEFRCGIGRPCSCTNTLIDEKLVEYLQKIRDHFNAPVSITSAHRCESYNKSIGGATGSRHTKGQAADIVVKGVKPAEVAKYAESIGILGIGLYETDKDGHFVHIDTRTYKSFWYGQGQAYRSTFGGATEKKSENNEDKLINTVKEVQNWANTNYKSGLDEDGIYGNRTKKALVKILQTEINKAYSAKGVKLVVDGIWGSNTKAACPTLHKGSKGNIVGVLQALLICNGYTGAYLDKDYGNATYNAVKSYQSKNGLDSDGIAGKNTFAKLCG